MFEMKESRMKGYFTPWNKNVNKLPSPCSSYAK